MAAGYDVCFYDGTFRGAPDYCTCFTPEELSRIEVVRAELAILKPEYTNPILSSATKSKLDPNSFAYSIMRNKELEQLASLEATLGFFKSQAKAKADAEAKAKADAEAKAKADAEANTKP